MLLFLFKLFVFYFIINQFNAFPDGISEVFLSKNDSDLTELTKSNEKHDDDDDASPSGRLHPLSAARIKVEQQRDGESDYKSSLGKWHSEIGTKIIKEKPIVGRSAIKVEADHEQFNNTYNKNVKVENDQQQHIKEEECSRRYTNDQNLSDQNDQCSDENSKETDHSFKAWDEQSDQSGRDGSCKSKHISSQISVGYTDEEKIKIVKKYMEIKKAQMMQAVKSRKAKAMDREIVNQLGVSKSTIYRWKKEHGVHGMRRSNPSGSSQAKQQRTTPAEIKKVYSDEEKKKIFENYRTLKKHGQFENDTQIAKELGICRSTLHLWKTEFEFYKRSADEKKKIEKKKMKIFQRYKKLKHKNPKQNDSELAKKLHLGSKKLSNLRREYDHDYKKKNRSEKEKFKLLTKYFKMKRKHPELNQKNVAKLLNISKTTINRWKREIAEKINGTECDENNYYSTSSSAQFFPRISDQKTWEWNWSTKKRTKSAKNDQIGNEFKQNFWD